MSASCTSDRSLASLLRHHLAPESPDLQPILPHDDAEWESLISLASAQAVLPALHQSVIGSNLTAHLPQEIAECFSAVAELNRERNVEILSQLHDITAALNGVGVEPIALKGLAYIFAGTYADPGARYLSDIDLLVPPAQLGTAMQVLRNIGYHPDQEDPIASFRHHLPTLSRPGCLPVELHHAVGLGICQKLLPAAELIQDSSLINWNGVRLRVPSPDHLVSHLVIHSQLLHPYRERIWPPLRALYDLALLQRRFACSIHWPSIASRFRSQHEYATLALHLLQAEQSLRTPLPISLSLSWLTRLRWTRRQLLRRFPALRFFDPLFLFSSAVSRRARVVKHMLVSGAWPQLLKRLSQPSLYRSLNSEIDIP